MQVLNLSGHRTYLNQTCRYIHIWKIWS